MSGAPSLPLYQQIAQRCAQLVASGALRAGQRLPSVRDTATQNHVSVSTAVQALQYLEERGVLTARAKAGFFVAPQGKAKALSLLRQFEGAAPEPLAGEPAPPPGSLPPKVSFAGYSPKDKDFFDGDRIRVALSRATRLQRQSLTEYSSAIGTTPLRNAVALRAMHLGCTLQADDIVITAGCINAITMCLQAVTQPGDMVAVESPTFFGFLDLLEALNLKAFPLPTDARTGVSLPALQLALDTQPIKALLLVPTLSNPLASVMPLTHKRQLAKLVAQYRIPLIEDVVFNDLLATDTRRRAVKAYDTEGWVMVCGSFAKTVAPGIRLGWVEAGRWGKQVATLKRVQGAATNAVLEAALADLLVQGSYEAHLRRLSAMMKQRLGLVRQIIQASFPAGSKVNDPPAGYTLWVELPGNVDTMVLFALCKAQGITIGPGQLFCGSQRYRHCLRLSFAGHWGPKEQAALQQVGRLAAQLVQGLHEHADSVAPEASRTDFVNQSGLSARDLW
ncbi:PLP-dependent aminotransferase family protein [Curvibacter sp. APW13]|uniref:aminotransferase-like domain-containing protein n=1 Tax=Curvibacter sp. APW13 TaxID=3077236 RepID=UPI0028DEC436|nr:PLP-dependent aminotransferase family protein [Curvibacter sp. APW13]MDT8989974.1 PLP-dependent aminotransferase family protein [Curvibacter sp. APW13]